MKLNKPRWAAFVALSLLLFVLAPAASADHEPIDGSGDVVTSTKGKPDQGSKGKTDQGSKGKKQQEETPELQGPQHDPGGGLIALDAATAGDVISDGPFADVIKNLAPSGHGERLVSEATTDVWVLDGFGYLGTFQSPCGDGTGDNGSGIRIFRIQNPNDPANPDINRVKEVGFLPSVAGSRSNDVKVANLNSGRILVHSNEPCTAGGLGGFEIWNVDDPLNAVHIAHVQTDDVNGFLRAALGFVDFGVHNLFLFTQDDRDYAAAVVESEFGNFQVFDITDPTDPALVGFWGAEELRMAELGLDPSLVPGLDADDFGIIVDLDAWLFDGFGLSTNRFLHDITISADGARVYLSNWDAGLVLLDISDPTDPTLVSVALDPVNGSRDGEVNSHAAWPNEDGTVVVETEEDFASWVSALPLSNFTFGDDLSTNTIPGVGISTLAGDDFEANQTGNNVTVTATSVTVNIGPLAGTVYAAVEGFGNQPKLGTVSIIADAVWIGRACNGDTILNAGSFEEGDVAIVRRGACFFSDKLANAAALGASAIVIANNLRDDTPWSGVRIWDYSDPSDPVLASVFDTTCSASPSPIAECDLRGTYSAHNVIVEGERAYLSWYTDGVLILDISDPYNPVEVARYHREGPAFETENGGIQDVWGIFKEVNSPWIYASDRNGGLYVLKEFGSGSAKEGQP